MSGCSVWRLMHEGTTEAPGAVSGAEVIAIQTSESKTSETLFVRATKWGPVIIQMANSWPDILPAIRIRASIEEFER
jgi:hypothetical protein